MILCTLGGESRKFILVFPFSFHILLLNYILPITSLSSIDLYSSNLLFLIVSFTLVTSPSPFDKAHLTNLDRTETPKYRTRKRIHS